MIRRNSASDNTPRRKRDFAHSATELSRACPLAESGIVNESRYRTRTLPAAGALLREEDAAEKQISLEEL